VSRRQIGLGLIVANAIVGCHSAPAPRTPTPSGATTTTPPQQRDLLVSATESFTPRSGDAAIQAFVPEVAPVDSGGECLVTRTAGSGAMTVGGFFPRRSASQTTMSVTFDSAGHVVRFSDRRGVPKPIVTAGMTTQQRDSALRAAANAVRSTTISLDYAVDQAMVMNRGAGKPTDAIIGPVRAIEKLEKLGPPTARLERLRRLCGV